MKPRRGRQRKFWCKVVDNCCRQLFSSLGLDIVHGFKLIVEASAEQPGK